MRELISPDRSTAPREVAADPHVASKALPVHCIARNSWKVVRRPAVIRTVTGAGFALVVYLRGSKAGGVLHLPVPVPGLANHIDALEPIQKVRLRRFIAELSKADGTLAGAKAEIVGGADVMKLLPSHLRERTALKRATTLANCLAEYGLQLGRLEVGGEVSRRLLVDTQQQRTRIVKEGPPRRSASLDSRDSVDTIRSIEPLPQATRMVDIGELAVARAPDCLSVLLGSCVGVMLWDPGHLLGALAHVQLPHSPDPKGREARYADTAILALCDALVDQGAQRQRLKAKLVGGAAVLYQTSEGPLASLGDRNVEVARKALRTAGIDVLGEVVGGRRGYRLSVDFSSFALQISRLGRLGED